LHYSIIHNSATHIENPKKDYLDINHSMNTPNNDDIFSTEHLTENLRGHALRGGSVSFIGQIIKFILQLISISVFARLLTPTDFGLIAMVAAVTNLVLVFKDLGLSMATVQQERITHEQVSNLFWINASFGFIILIIMASISPVIAWFYDEQKLTLITIVLSIGILISGFSVQHQALLRRQMKYLPLTIVEVLSVLLGLLGAIGSALLGWGYWSLVTQQLIVALTNLIGVWVCAKWIPGKPTRGIQTKNMLNFGKNMTINGLINYLVKNLDNVFIGRVLGASALGYYSRAYSLLLAPLSQISTPVSAVANPTLSRLQNDPIRFRNYYFKAITFIAYATIPLVTFMAVLSKEIVEIIMGAQWIQTAKIFQFLSVAAICQPISNAIGWILISLGRADRLVKWGLISSPLIIISFLIGLHWGAEGVAICYSIISAVLIFPQIAFATHKTTIKPKQILSILFFPIVIALLIAVSSFLILDLSKTMLPILRILVCLVADACVCLIFYLLSNRLRAEIKNIMDIIKSFIKIP
jgi:PST family polysaccharide transporter